MIDSRPISILIPNLKGGGAERVAVTLANEFVARGLLTDLVLMRADGVWLAALDPRVRVIDLHVSRLRNLLWPLVRYLRSSRPSVLMAYMWPVTVIAFAARILSATWCRLVFSEHTTWSGAEIYQVARTRVLIKLTMRSLYRFADAVLAVSVGSARDLERIAWLRPGGVETIYNPIVGANRSVPAPLQGSGVWVAGDHRRVIAVGSLKKIKGYSTLLRAFEMVCRNVDARLLILGEGDQRDELESLAGELGLSGRVHMPGFTTAPAQYWEHADLHVLSSDGEGFGNVLVEALEHGVPVVSTDCPSGPREILCDGRYGRLVPPGDPDALAIAMLESLREVPDREALMARARDFTVGAIADQYLHVLLPERGGK